MGIGCQSEDLAMTSLPRHAHLKAQPQALEDELYVLRCHEDEQSRFALLPYYVGQTRCEIEDGRTAQQRDRQAS